jgi:predicted nucleic acid-binding protein
LPRKKHASAIVLDGSVALAWCFADETDSYADAVARSSPHLQIVVPVLWYLEVANALLAGERRRRCTSADTVRWMGFLGLLPVVVDEETAPRAWTDTLLLARAHGLSVYDAAYLELALRRRLPLATLDRALKKAAKKAGVVLYAA